MSKPKLVAILVAVIALTAGHSSAQHYYGGEAGEFAERPIRTAEVA